MTPEPDYTTALVLARLRALEAGEQPERTAPARVSAPGRATLIFGLDDLPLAEQAALQRRWLARWAMPVEIRKEFEEPAP